MFREKKHNKCKTPVTTVSTAQALTAKRRLEGLAEELNHPAEDLLNWYSDDLDAIAGMPADQLRFIVTDYLSNRDFYRNQHAEKFS